MRKTWALISGLGLFVLVLGCQSSRPELKPADSPEVLSVPPAENRFNVASYPKEAFNNRDPLKKLNASQDVVPVRGGPSMPGGQLR